MQRLAATPMDVAHRGADLRVAVGVDILFQEIDQPAVALQDRQHAQVGAGRCPRVKRLDPAAKSASVRIRQNVWRASQIRFKAQPFSCRGSHTSSGRSEAHSRGFQTGRCDEFTAIRAEEAPRTQSNGRRRRCKRHPRSGAESS